VIIPDISNPFFGMAIRGCEDSLYESEYSLILCNTNEDVERERYNLEMLLSRGVDGLILWGTRICCSDLEQLTGPNLPLVTVELRDAPTNPGHTSINVDNVQGAYEVTRHLLENGRRRVAYLAGPEGRLTAERRLTGYQQALEEAGIPLQPSLIQPGRPSIRGGHIATQELLKQKKVQAIFCYNDLMAVGAMVAARDLGLNIPDDLAIAGFDDIVLAAMTEPPLTTVRIAQYELGKLSGKLLLENLQVDKPGPRSILFPVELVVRGSTGSDNFSADDRQKMLDNLVSSLSADLAIFHGRETEFKGVQNAL
jgi:DNA-binding LacI/PurR family transcriptional regulator